MEQGERELEDRERSNVRSARFFRRIVAIGTFFRLSLEQRQAPSLGRAQATEKIAGGEVSDSNASKKGASPREKSSEPARDSPRWKELSASSKDGRKTLPYLPSRSATSP